MISYVILKGYRMHFLCPVDCIHNVHTRDSNAATLQVVEKLMRGLAMEDSRNMFALFEHNDTVDKAIESRSVVADVLAKFEK